MGSRRISRASKLIASLVAAVLVVACVVAAAVEQPGATSNIPSGTSSLLPSPVRPRPHTPAPAVAKPAPRPRRAGTAPVPAAACSVPPLAKPAPGLVVGRVTAIGDSVMMDIESALEADVKRTVFDAYVGQQWYEGVSDVQQMRADRQLGSVVIVELGTNGPIDSADFNDMMKALVGVSRVVVVTNFVPDDWQDPNNAVLEAGAKAYKNVAVANWEPLGAAHPDWFYGDVGPHMPEGGPGAQAMAGLIAECV
jgi:hypothetical protein